MSVVPRMPVLRLLAASELAIAAVLVPAMAQADPVTLPVLVPVTGFLALEGTSQRNGALMALRTAPDLARAEVQDTGTAPETAVNAFEKSLAGSVAPPAIVAPMLGTQMLALLPLAQDRRVPLVTISGTAQITEQGNAYVFRFFPGDAVVNRRRTVDSRLLAVGVGHNEHPLSWVWGTQGACGYS